MNKKERVKGIDYCNRTACAAPLREKDKVWWNKSTRAYYYMSNKELKVGDKVKIIIGAEVHEGVILGVPDKHTVKMLEKQINRYGGDYKAPNLFIVFYENRSSIFGSKQAVLIAADCLSKVE